MKDSVVGLWLSGEFIYFFETVINAISNNETSVAVRLAWEETTGHFWEVILFLNPALIQVTLIKDDTNLAQQILGQPNYNESNTLSVTINDGFVTINIDGIKTDLFHGLFQKPESFLRSEGYLQGTVQGTEPLPYDVDYYIDDLVAYSSTDPTKDNILAFFDDSVEAGTIVGRGNRFANFRLWLMQTMLQAAAEFIEQDLIGLSCFMLNGAHRRSDGEPRPRDFIEGEAVPAMMVMIEDLMESLGCDNF